MSTAPIGLSCCSVRDNARSHNIITGQVDEEQGITRSIAMHRDLGAPVCSCENYELHVISGEAGLPLMNAMCRG